MGKGPTESTYTHTLTYPDLRASKQLHAASVFSSENMGEEREGTYLHIGLSAKQEMRL